MIHQLLPDARIADAFNIRATEQLDIVGTKVNGFVSNALSQLLRPISRELQRHPFDVHAFLDTRDQQYRSWDPLFGPENNGLGNFTNLARWNLNDRVAAEDRGGFVVSGYQGRPLPLPLFSAENIVLMTDGTCASTCTIFANLLKLNGVRSVLVGGRPQDGQVQAIGGVKGANVYSFSLIYWIANTTFHLTTNQQERQRLEATELGQIVREGPYVLARTLKNGAGSRVNFRNSIRVDDQARIPTQFVYEPANCRIWNRPDTLFSPEATWRAVADAAWGGKGCTPGSVTP
jgi:hypothetical protein